MHGLLYKRFLGPDRYAAIAGKNPFTAFPVVGLQKLLSVKCIGASER